MRARTNKSPDPIREADDPERDEQEDSGGAQVIRIAKTAAPPPMKYRHCEFQAKSKADDPEQIPLGVNGDTLVIRREMPLILPDSYLEVARHATYPNYVQEPGKDRKVEGRTVRFPYRILYERGNNGEATEAEFLAMREAGTKEAARNAMQQAA